MLRRAARREGSVIVVSSHNHRVATVVSAHVIDIKKSD